MSRTTPDASQTDVRGNGSVGGLDDIERKAKVASLEEMLADPSLIDTSVVPGFAPLGLMEFADLPDDPAAVLLGDRWLLRNAVGVIFAPSGVGKSSMIAQATAAWALGEAAFGIDPARKLRFAVFQSEDDPLDIKEIALGVRSHLGYSPEECQEINERVQFYRSRKSGTAFVKGVLLPVLEATRPDVIIINPVMSFIGGDLSSQELTQQAFRGELSSVLEAYNVGCLLVHHTGKPRDTDVSKMSRYAAQYLTFGSSDLVNMIRGQLFLWPTDVPGLFEFHALKRGEKIGWLKRAGSPENTDEFVPEFVRYFRHHRFTPKGAKKPCIAWVDADAADIALAQESKKKSRRASKGGFESGLNSLLLLDALEPGTHTTKAINAAVANFFKNEKPGKAIPSEKTIQRALREAVILGQLTHNGYGCYTVPEGNSE